MTSSEIAVRETPQVDSWAAVMPDVVRLSQHLEDTEFVPKTLRGRPAAIAAAILAGREAGIGPMRSLSHMHIVDGRPSMSAEQKRAQALAAGHEIVYVETGTTRCVVKGRRRGSDQWSTVTWTLDDAKAAKLDGKDNWRKWPRRMLQARATGELCDMLFPDATAGLATYEELVDDTDAAGITSNGEVPKKRTARRQTAVQATAERVEETPQTQQTPPSPQPPLPGEEGYDEIVPAEASAEDQPKAATGPSVGISKPQQRMMHALFNQLGYSERDDRLHAASIIIGRKLDTSNDLNKEEAKALIDTLGNCAAQDDPAKALRGLLDTIEKAEPLDGEIVEDEG